MEKRYVVEVIATAPWPFSNYEGENHRWTFDPCSEEEAKRLVELINGLARPMPKRSERKHGESVDYVNADLMEILAPGLGGSFNVGAYYYEHRPETTNLVPEMIQKLESLRQR